MYTQPPTYPLNYPIVPSGQAAPPPTVPELQAQLNAQKSYTNVALVLALGATAVAVYKHVACVIRVSRTETEYLRKSERMATAAQAGGYGGVYAPPPPPVGYGGYGGYEQGPWAPAGRR